jgi:hypothetical protein
MTSRPSAGVFFRSVACLHVELPRVDVEPSGPAEHRRSSLNSKENPVPLRNPRLRPPPFDRQLAGKATQSVSGGNF